MNRALRASGELRFAAPLVYITSGRLVGLAQVSTEVCVVEARGIERDIQLSRRVSPFFPRLVNSFGSRSRLGVDLGIVLTLSLDNRAILAVESREQNLGGGREIAVQLLRRGAQECLNTRPVARLTDSQLVEKGPTVDILRHLAAVEPLQLE